MAAPRTTKIELKFVKGQAYVMADSNGMFVKRGKFLGVMENKYIKKQIFLFEKDDLSLFGATPYTRMEGDGTLSVRLMASFYGNSLSELASGGRYKDEWERVR